MGKEVVFANLSFTYLHGTDATFITPAMARVTARTQGESRYFPEGFLCQWFESRGEPTDIYAFQKLGVAPLREAYRWIVEHEKVDAIVLVDGGTDILMRGDEAGLGTPEEDMTSLCAVSGLDVPIRIVSCLGFGIDAFHGVCHAHFLENAAALEKAGAGLGVHSVSLSTKESQLFRAAVEYVHARMPGRESIVNSSILSALEGYFGDHHRTKRTKGSELFINPLMALYWHFDLKAIAERSLYLPRLEGTETIWEVKMLIERFRHEVKFRTGILLPV
jgi:hypothetical protein